jgi:hypothetical protein
MKNLYTNLLLGIMLFALVGCSSWFSSNVDNPPTVGAKSGSDMWFGQSASAPVSNSDTKSSSDNGGSQQ